MNVLKNETENSILFIDEYLQYTNDTNKNIFIRHVSNTWTNIFNYLENSTEYSIDKKSSYLRLLFKNIPVSKIKELNKNKSIFYFLNYSESLASIYFEDDNKTKVEQFLKDEKVQFDRLIFDDKHVQLLKFIYENNLYEINFDMIKLMVSVFKTNDVDLKELNLKIKRCNERINELEDKLEKIFQLIGLEPLNIRLKIFKNEEFYFKSKPEKGA